MIKLKDVPEPGVLMAPANFAHWAETNLQLAESHETALRNLKEKLGDPLNDDVVTEMDREVNAQSVSVCSAILFAALEVEATLNFHGVVRLGNEYFDRNLERLKPEEKLAGIVAVTSGNLIEHNDEINVVLKRVFAARNRVAHPKTKAYPDWDSAEDPKDETIGTARQVVKDMRRFLDLFRQLVPWTFHSSLRGDESDE